MKLYMLRIMPALAMAVIAWAGAAVSSATPYNDAVLGSGPKYYWTFDEDGVADALEQVSGNAADVFRPSAESAKAPSTSTPGGISLGQALALDNTVTSVWNTDDLSGPAFSGAWAVEVWFNSADPQAYQYIVGSQAENGFNTGTIAQFSNFEDDPGNPRILLFTLFSAPHSFNSDSAPQSDGWHHWVFVTKTPTQGTDVYRDGTLLGTFGSESVIAPFPARELRAGGWSPTPVGENFTGQIDELAYYDLSGLDEAALAAKGEEIANHYNPDAGIPTIDTQPEGQSVNPGANVTFTVAASGGALTYLWEKFGAGWEPIAGATSASLVLNAVTAADAGQYRVRVTNAAGPINSLPATLDVIPTQTAYNSAVLASNPTYYWTFDEAGLAHAKEQVSGNARDVFRPSAESAKAPSTSTPGGTNLGQALALDRDATSVWNTGDLSGPAFTGAWAYEVWINSADPDQYNYILGSQAEGGFNNGSILQFSNFAPDPGTPHIFVYPAWPGETATALQSAGWHHWVFVNKPDGGGSEVYQNGVSLGAFQQGLSLNIFPARELRAGGWSPTPGAENFTGQIDELAIYDLAGLDEAALAAKGQEIAGHYNLGIPVPTINSQPMSQRVLSGANVTFTVEATGGVLTYQWQKFGADWGPIAGATSASLVLNAVTAADDGQYRVRVTNAAGAINSVPATLDVIPPPTAYNSAVLASNPTYYWTFDEAGLANAREQMGVNAGDVFRPSSESAKVPSTTTAGGASLGQALALDRDATSVWNTGDLSGPAFTGAWAYEVWINSAAPDQYNYILGSQAEGGFNNGSILQFSNFDPDAGTPHIFVYPAWPAETATALQSAGWHHWVFVNKPDGGGSEVYQNGVFLGAFQQGLSLNIFPARELRAGGWSPTPQPENFTGQIDELAIYDLAGLDEAALAAKGQEIAAHYLAGGGFHITEILRNAATNEISLTWTSSPGSFYAVYFGTDLNEFTNEVSDSIPAAPDGSQTTLTFDLPEPNSPQLFFRVGRQ